MKSLVKNDICKCVLHETTKKHKLQAETLVFKIILNELTSVFSKKKWLSRLSNIKVNGEKYVRKMNPRPATWLLYVVQDTSRSFQFMVLRPAMSKTTYLHFQSTNTYVSTTCNLCFSNHVDPTIKTSSEVYRFTTQVLTDDKFL